MDSVDEQRDARALRVELIRDRVAVLTQEIDAAFGENEDPMFGQDWSNEFSELFNDIVNRLPAPLGLGEAWR